MSKNTIKTYVLLAALGAPVYASLVVILVFVPVFFLEGLAGAFFRPLAMSYVIAIVASLLVALTVTPALSYMLLRGHGSERPEAPLTTLLRRMYRAVLPADRMAALPTQFRRLVAAQADLIRATARDRGNAALPAYTIVAGR